MIFIVCDVYIHVHILCFLCDNKKYDYLYFFFFSPKNDTSFAFISSDVLFIVTTMT